MQWRIFAEHLNLDAKERNERTRDMAEYAMAFHNYEAVSKVQEDRRRQESFEDLETEDIFLQQLKGLGIDLDRETMYAARDKAQQEQESVGSSPQPEAEDTMRVTRPPKGK